MKKSRQKINLVLDLVNQEGKNNKSKGSRRKEIVKIKNELNKIKNIKNKQMGKT